MAQEDSSIKMVSVLTVIMICSAIVLTFTFSYTKPKIEAYKANQTKQAILEVLPGATEYETMEEDGLELYKGFDENGDLVGTAFETEGVGFQGVIKMMIGFDLKNDKVLAVKILDHQETPGLGARITEPWFEDQFQDKNFSDQFEAQKDVESIAGATISSQAVSDIIEEAANKVQSSVSSGGE
ncbi:MAG: RnfABCDGE type electron transport complex subunit G [Bacillota bacterium]